MLIIWFVNLFFPIANRTDIISFITEANWVSCVIGGLQTTSQLQMGGRKRSACRITIEKCLSFALFTAVQIGKIKVFFPVPKVVIQPLCWCGVTVKMSLTPCFKRLNPSKIELQHEVGLIDIFLFKILFCSFTSLLSTLQHQLDIIIYQWRLVTEKIGEEKTRGGEPVHGVMLFYPIVNYLSYIQWRLSNKTMTYKQQNILLNGKRLLTSGPWEEQSDTFTLKSTRFSSPSHSLHLRPCPSVMLAASFAFLLQRKNNIYKWIKLLFLCQVLIQLEMYGWKKWLPFIKINILHSFWLTKLCIMSYL